MERKLIRELSLRQSYAPKIKYIYTFMKRIYFPSDNPWTSINITDLTNKYNR